MRIPDFLHNSRAAAAGATGMLHVLFVLAFWMGSGGPGALPPLPKPIPVELIQEESPKDIAAQAGRVRKPQRAVTPKKPVENASKKPDPDRTAPEETTSMEAPAVPESVVDCRYMDEAACSPCLADPKICTACCQKSDMDGAGGTDDMAPTSPSGTCLNPPCAPVDPCPADALSEMTSSFCPKVRAAIYARLGSVRLSLPEDTELSARIQITVSAAGSLSLAGIVASSGNAQFDAAVRNSVSQAAAVLPPSRIVGCVSSRGCIFPVTIGAKSGSAMEASP
ncbi:MAG: hypothetical protein CVU65_07235 [Deltaproteobacteria bacterium HGW-Deltaproteobacteria-22]|nr:MAG: hypothetical protein CVU65_07235 [Deltaproteobacteria bacterium HGW-Deltaproteobacteria-22]